MVKNTKGGSGHKGQARKHTVSNGGSTKLRLSEDSQLEQYAFIVKRLGGEFCHVKCQDGEIRLCVIRGKFRSSRGKRDNMITSDSWVLVGIRDWETSYEKKNAMQKCDLLEVYKETDKLKLRNVPGINWSIFIANDDSVTKNKEKLVDPDDIVFSNDAGNDEYEELMGDLAISKKKISLTTDDQVTKLETLEEVSEEDDEINIDDI